MGTGTQRLHFQGLVYPRTSTKTFQPPKTRKYIFEIKFKYFRIFIEFLAFVLTLLRSGAYGKYYKQIRSFCCKEVIEMFQNYTIFLVKDIRYRIQDREKWLAFV